MIDTELIFNELEKGENLLETANIFLEEVKKSQYKKIWYKDALVVINRVKDLENNDLKDYNVKGEKEKIISNFTDLIFKIEEYQEKEKAKEVKENANTSENSNEISQAKNASDFKTLHQAIEYFAQEKDKLNHKTSKEEIEELEKVRSEIVKELFGDYQQTITSITILQNKFIINLFETIMTSEQLSSSTSEDIAEVRSNKEDYKYYDRSVIVSALTLSVLSHKKFDPKKVNLLIDFLTDFEPEVYERALVAVVLSSIIHQNRLQRHQLVPRLQALQKIEQVQIGIYMIDAILRHQLYQEAFFPNELAEDDFLKENPYNWFCPFYEENQVIKEMFAETEQDIEEELFLALIYNIPFINALKYSICNQIKHNKAEFKVEEKVADTEKKLSSHIDEFTTGLNPFYNIIAELYLYYKFYPKERVKQIFDKKITLAQSKLKNIILSKVQALQLSADLHFEKEEYESCIYKLRELLNIEPNQISALQQIGECHELREEYSKALTYYYEIEKLKPNNFNNKLCIGKCLNQNKQYKKSNEYLLEANELKNNQIEVLNSIGNNYGSLKNYSKSIEYFDIVLSLDKDNQLALRGLSRVYDTLNNVNEAITYTEHLYKITPNDPEVLVILGRQKIDLGYTKEGIELGFKAFDLEQKNPLVLLGHGIILFQSEDFEKAKVILKKVFRVKNSKEWHAKTYGNLGHIALFEGNTDEAMEYYQKCVLGFEDIEEFKESFDRDLKYALKQGISEEKYNQIKEDMVAYWIDNKD